MGTYEKGILGTFSGLVGPVVGATFRGKNVMRSRPRKSKKLPSRRQMEQRMRFVVVTQFMSPAKDVLSVYFGTPSGTRSRYNLAMSYYLQEAVELNGNLAVIIYSRALFSKGSLLAPQNMEATMEPDGKLAVAWIDNSEQGSAMATDKLVVVVYYPETASFEFFMDAGTRGDAATTIALPGYLAGAKVQVWAFMASTSDQLKTTSQYLGEMTVL